MPRAKAYPDRNEILRDLDYDTKTGAFTWKTRPSTEHRAASFNANYAGQEAGNVDISTGYRRIRLRGRIRFAHRLAWIVVHGPIPDGYDIDHKNMDRADNSIENLRLATNSQNQANSYGNGLIKSGLKGAYTANAGRTWFSQIMSAGKRVYLGSFSTKEAAAAAYYRAAKRLNGEFARGANVSDL